MILEKNFRISKNSSQKIQFLGAKNLYYLFMVRAR